MNDVIDKINSNSWADRRLLKIEIDFEKITVIISEDNAGSLTICCKDYIGFSLVGHWDESVIEDIFVETEGVLIDESIQSVKKNYGEKPLPGGGVKNISDIWYQVNIKLIDGNMIRVACKNIEVGCF